MNTGESHADMVNHRSPQRTTAQAPESGFLVNAGTADAGHHCMVNGFGGAGIPRRRRSVATATNKQP
ncbi:hypothetical protein [Streptomyces decoyicus]|uniref:hypothetical protein n=1 Tax=Streptomyces decoyicus TaxID=249567 RepID=UPI0036520108